MNDKEQEKPRKRKNKAEATKYYRDGEVVDEFLLPVGEDGEKELFRTIMMFCPESLLQEIDYLSDFNFVERSDFVDIAARLLLDYLDTRSIEEIAAKAASRPMESADADDFLMSKERYPYNEEEDGEDGGLWAAEEEDDEGE